VLLNKELDRTLFAFTPQFGPFWLQLYILIF